MSVHSAGLLLFKYVEGRLAMMLVHPGGNLRRKPDLTSMER
jgi:predicted NUDIX family NTP pyrophosphohydrolase